MTTIGGATVDPVTRGLARFLATRLTGIDLIDGAFLDTTAEVEDDGYITVEVTRWNFRGDDTTVRVLLHITTPMRSAYAEDAPRELAPAHIGLMDGAGGGSA